MKNIWLTLSIIIAFTTLTLAQTITFKPYLQDATPHSMVIMWQTDINTESIVAYGETDAVAIQTIGTSEAVENIIIHTVRIEGLNPFTKYFYKVITGSAESEIHNFRTPPHSQDHEPFRIVAMSDMQRDGSHPNKFNEIIHDGVLDYLQDEIGGEVIDNLALVMIPGDLVVTGNSFNQWTDHFFGPAQDLLSQVPVYPVPGNHEQNTIYYFKYFNLPDNGTEGFEEHWYYKDYGNVRIVGLDSNGSYAGEEQLEWLDQVLTNTCSLDSIDFVFAQLHHPHKSELWTPGEKDYTGDVINLLENFSTDCGKPSLHFFGHTHGYSRGHSRDHKHLMMNVATAGGAIDNWGEFPNFDYDEFVVSEDEYGFVTVEITGDENPSIVVKRITRGDQDVTIDNVQTDEIRIYKNNEVINIPTPLSPINETILPQCVVLKASPFAAQNAGLQHAQTHWQVTAIENDYSTLVAEEWKSFENWYFEVNTQAEDDLTDQEISGLEENQTYYWRVRYRDKTLNWSDWTNSSTFTVGESSTTGNLLINYGAEDSLMNWTIEEGVVEAVLSNVCNGITSNSGDYYFAVGGICEHSDFGHVSQIVDVQDFQTEIDAEEYSAHYGGYFSTFSGTDRPSAYISFLDGNQTLISQAETLTTLSSSWILLDNWVDIPAGTRFIKYSMTGQRNAGTDNDSYLDDHFLKLGENDVDCTDVVRSHDLKFRQHLLTITPNPVVDQGNIQLPKSVDYSNIQMYITDIKGNKVSCDYTIENGQIILQRNGLIAGTYFFYVRDQNRMIGGGKMVVI